MDGLATQICRSWSGPKFVSKRSEARFPPCPAQIGPDFQMVVLLEPMLGFQPCVVEIGGQFPEKWWRVVACQATILWVQLRERGQEKEIKLDAAAFCCHAR